MDEKVALIERDRDEVLKTCATVEVRDAQSEKYIGNLLITLTETEKKILGFIKEHTDPLEKERKFWFSVRDKLLQPILDKKSQCRQALLDYRNWLEDQRRHEEERLRKLAEKRQERAAEKGKPPPIPEVIIPYVDMPEKTQHTDNGKITYVTKKVATLVDIYQVPMFHNGVQILFPDLRVVQKIFDAGFNVPGFELKEEIHTRVG